MGGHVDGTRAGGLTPARVSWARQTVITKPAEREPLLEEEMIGIYAGVGASLLLALLFGRADRRRRG
jgi:hypothetical protein